MIQTRTCDRERYQYHTKEKCPDQIPVVPEFLREDHRSVRLAVESVEKSAAAQRAKCHRASQQCASSERACREPAVQTDQECDDCHHAYRQSFEDYPEQEIFRQYRLISRSRLLIHHFSAVRLQSQRDRRQTVRQQVYEKQMHRSERYRQRQHGRIHHGQYRAEIARQQELYRVLDIPVQVPAILHRLYYRGEIVISQHHRGRILCDFTARYTHRNAYVSLLERRRIIYAVACHRNDVALFLPCPDDPYLMLRRHPRIHGYVLHIVPELLIAHAVDRRTVARLGLVLQYSDLLGYRRRSDTVISRYHHRLYPGFDALGDCCL